MAGAARQSLPRPRVGVAYSGGRDSTALLHATARAGKALEIDVVALHVHHGLNERADAWVRHGAATCRRWAARGLPVAFACERLASRPAAGDSVEAWARAERYAALTRLAQAHDVKLVLLAHHRRDQAETLLLQALRGGGIAGLASMPLRSDRDGIVWARPWLHQGRGVIESYVRRHRLAYVDDDSNLDLRYARNRLRALVWPALEAAFGDAEQTLAAAAGWAQEAHQLLAEQAAIDVAEVADGHTLDLQRWRSLSSARRSQALRAWLTGSLGRAAPASLIHRLMRELDAPSAARWPIAGGELRRHRHCVVFVPTRSALTEPQAGSTVIGIGQNRLPGWAGVLLVEAVAEHGLAQSRLSMLRPTRRRGAEHFQLGPRRPARSLKKQFQAMAIPAWEREGPLLYCGDDLVFAPGLGIDARAWAGVDEAQVSLRWMPDEPAH